MSREKLLSQLEHYGHRHLAEVDTVRRFEKFVLAHTDCFERTLQSGHVTGSAWLVNRTGSHVLLTHHRKLDKWLQLGGHADGCTDALAVALKEAMEESGIESIVTIDREIFDIDIHAIPARGTEPGHHHYDVRFALRVQGNEDFIVSEESHALAWIAINRLSEITGERSMLRMAEKWQSYLINHPDTLV